MFVDDGVAAIEASVVCAEAVSVAVGPTVVGEGVALSVGAGFADEELALSVAVGFEVPVALGLSVVTGLAVSAEVGALVAVDVATLVFVSVRLFTAVFTADVRPRFKVLPSVAELAGELLVAALVDVASASDRASANPSVGLVEAEAAIVVVGEVSVPLVLPPTT